MKQILCFLLLNYGVICAAQPYIITGHLRYPYDFKPKETFTLTYQNVSIQCNIDSFPPGEIIRLLTNCNIPKDKIIYVTTYGSSQTKHIEFFFAYEGTISNTNQSSDISIDWSLRRVSPGYGAQGTLYVPNFNFIIDDSLKNVVKLVASKYPIRSFYVAFTMSELPFIVLANGSTNGNLADMRNIPNSYRLVPYFKERNFGIIHYRDENNVWKTIRKPANGWPK